MSIALSTTNTLATGINVTGNTLATDTLNVTGKTLATGTLNVIPNTLATGTLKVTPNTPATVTGSANLSLQGNNNSDANQGMCPCPGTAPTPLIGMPPDAASGGILNAAAIAVPEIQSSLEIPKETTAAISNAATKCQNSNIQALKETGKKMKEILSSLPKRILASATPTPPAPLAPSSSSSSSSATPPIEPNPRNRSWRVSPVKDILCSTIENLVDFEALINAVTSSECKEEFAYKFKNNALTCHGNCPKKVPALKLLPAADRVKVKEGECVMGCAGEWLIFCWMIDEFDEKMFIYQDKKNNLKDKLEQETQKCINPKDDKIIRECFGMDPKCLTQLDQSCNNNGLSAVVAKASVKAITFKECDNSKATYNENKCFEIFEKYFIRATLILRIQPLEMLAYICEMHNKGCKNPEEYYEEEKNPECPMFKIPPDTKPSIPAPSGSGGNLRYLTSSLKIDDAALSQIKDLPASATSVDSSALVISGSTPTKSVTTSISKTAEATATQIVKQSASSYLLLNAMMIFFGFIIIFG
ncbi:MAG: hypothetical protein GY861_02010 [bacterium]|nr:hypothetical protein [bacterium]